MHIVGGFVEGSGKVGEKGRGTVALDEKVCIILEIIAWKCLALGDSSSTLILYLSNAVVPKSSI